MSLDALSATGRSQRAPDEQDPLAIAGQAFSHELSRQWDAVRQFKDPTMAIAVPEEPASTTLGQHAQMFGQAAADLLPTLAVGLAVHSVWGALLKAPKVGFNILEGVATGFVTGSFLHPDDEAQSESREAFYDGRAKSAVVGAVSLGLMSASSSGLSRLGSSLDSAGKLLTNPAVNGMLSGIPSGIFNAEVQSLHDRGSLTYDLNELARPLYGTALIGGTFGAITGSIAYVRDQHFSDYGYVRRALAQDSFSRERMEEWSDERVFFGALANYLRSDRVGNVPYVQKLIRAGADLTQLQRDSLTALRNLNDVLQPDARVFARTVELQRQGLWAKNLASFIEEDPAARRDWIHDAIDNGATVDSLSVDRLRGLESLSQLFDAQSPIATRLLSLEPGGGQLKAVWQLHEAFPQRQAEVVSLLSEVAQEDDPNKLQYYRLWPRLYLSERFGMDSPASLRLHELDKQGVQLVHIANAAQDDIYLRVAKAEIESGAPAESLKPERLQALAQLRTAYGADSPVVERLVGFERAGLPLIAVSDFAGLSKANTDSLAYFVDGAAGPSALRLGRLRDAVNLNTMTKWFGEDESAMSGLKDLQRRGLSALRLSRYIGEDPESRAPLVRELVARGAGVQRLNDQISLAVLPDAVASRLAETAPASQVNPGTILGHLRNWHSGEDFRNLLLQHVEAGKPISIDVIDQLASQSGALARQFGQGERSSQEVAARLEQTPERRARGLASASSDNPAAVESLAQALNKVADKISRKVPEDRTIVLLGRDSWPLLPALRERGRDVQYFLWSRLQIHDPKTQAQWLKEVPPHAFVIDTGFRGSIIDAIKKIDRTASGRLLSSNDIFKYRQFLSGVAGYDSVLALEAFPKVIGRAKTYTEHGSAVARFKSRDEDERVPDRAGYRWYVEAENKALLKEMNLPDWSAWRFSQFVGLSPLDRLMVNSDQDVTRHYERVQMQRSQRRWF